MFVVAVAGVLKLEAGTTDLKVLGGHVPRAAQGAVSQQHLPVTTRLNLALGLPLRDREGLSNLLVQIYDPSSPNFHHYLTPEEFTARFGPTIEDYQALIDFARGSGFTVTVTHPNRVVLDVSASVGDIERTFHVNLGVYPHPTEKRTFFAPNTEPVVPATLQLQDISGLDNFALPRPMNLKRPSPDAVTQATPSLGSGPGGSYLGNDFRAAYAPGVTLTGAGQIVGLLQFDGYYAADIAAYESLAGLPNVPLQNVLLDSFSGTPGANNDEVALDIEMSISMAPGLTKVIVYEAGPSGIPNDVLSRIATDNLAKQISASWTFSPVNTTSDQLFQQMAAQGQSYFNASGDSDAYTGAIPTPSGDLYVTSVGGTTLSTTGPGGAWSSETVWNWGGGTGSSGGVSTTFSIPSWQQGISMSANLGSTTMRNIPDVALTGDNVWVRYGNGSGGAFGGTSCASPLWAGFTALINQQAVANGRPTLGFPNPAIYALAKGPNYSLAFHDITTGNNTSGSSPSEFYAVAGYDLCTGWGTPNGANLINALAPPNNTPNVVAAGSTLLFESCAPTNGLLDPGETVTLNFTLQNNGGGGTTNLVATLLATNGVSAPSAPRPYGVLTANGGASSLPFTFTVTGACGGSVTALLQLQDGSANLGTVSFSFPIGKLVNANTLSENFDAVAPPALPAGWTSAASGAQVNWVTTTAAASSTPNSAFATDASNIGISELVSPAIPIVSASAQLSFRNNFYLESVTRKGKLTGYDGGVLEIQIGNGAWTDILSAGGSFAANGYNCTLSTSFSNPLGGRQAWSGNSGGFLTTTVNLPSSAAGQTVRLKWRCATDNGNGSTAIGWYIDSVSLADAYFACCNDSADLALSQSTLPTPAATVGQLLSYVVNLTNAGPQTAYNIRLTDLLPPSATFVSASPGSTWSNGSVLFPLSNLSAGSATNITISVRPAASGSLTNSISVAAITPDPNPANNTSTGLTPASVSTLTPPTIALIRPRPGASNVSLSCSSLSGLTYTLEYKKSLGDTNWTPILPSVPGNGSSITLQDTNPPALVSRFYRVRVQ